MRISCRRCAAGVAALIMSGIVYSPAMADPDISGKYAMQGKSDLATGPGYQGICEIKQNKSVYDVTCISGNDDYHGKGIVHGEDFSLYLGQFLLVYDIGNDGVLTGRWVNGVNGETGKETLTPKK